MVNPCGQFLNELQAFIEFKVFLRLKLKFFEQITFIPSWNNRLSKPFFKAKICDPELTVTLFMGFYGFNW